MTLSVKRHSSLMAFFFKASHSSCRATTTTAGLCPAGHCLNVNTSAFPVGTAPATCPRLRLPWMCARVCLHVLVSGPLYCKVCVCLACDVCGRAATFLTWQQAWTGRCLSALTCAGGECSRYRWCPGDQSHGCFYIFDICRSFAFLSGLSSLLSYGGKLSGMLSDLL